MFKFYQVAQPEDIRVGVYTILKSEKKFIDRYLASVEEAHSVYLLDTGSTDGSYEYLKELAETNKWKGRLLVDQQVFTPWHFGKARTANMRMIPSPEEGGPHILLQLDMDEVMTEGWVADFQKAAFEHPGFERLVYLYAWSHDKQGNPSRCFWYDKCHHNDSGYITKAAVHEYIAWGSPLPKPYNEGNFPVDREKVYKHHWPDISKSRSNYFDLLKVRAEEDPDDVNGLCYLSHEYAWRNMPKEALDVCFRILARITPKVDLGIYEHTLKEIGELFEKLGNFESAEIYYKQALEANPRLRDTYISYGYFLLRRQRIDDGLKLYDEMLEKSWRQNDWRELPEHWTWKPHDLKGCLLCWKGDYIGSLKEMDEALRLVQVSGSFTDYAAVLADYNCVIDCVNSVLPEAVRLVKADEKLLGKTMADGSNELLIETVDDTLKRELDELLKEKKTEGKESN